MVVASEVEMAAATAACTAAKMVGTAAARTVVPWEGAMEGMTVAIPAAEVARVEVVPQAAALGVWAVLTAVEGPREGSVVDKMVEWLADTTEAAAAVSTAAQPEESTAAPMVVLTVVEQVDAMGAMMAAPTEAWKVDMLVDALAAQMAERWAGTQADETEARMVEVPRVVVPLAAQMAVAMEALMVPGSAAGWALALIWTEQGDRWCL